MTQTAQRVDWDKRKAEWEQKLAELAASVTAWSQSRGWAVQRIDNTLSEDPVGKYAAPTLHIHTGTGPLVLEPVARNITAGEGRVDIYALRTFRRLLLIGKGRGWQIFTEDRVPWPEPWSDMAFIKIAESLTAS